MRGKLLFFDTNILYYTFDETEPEKRKISEKLIEKVFNQEIVGVISNQILGELFNSSPKLEIPLDKIKIFVKYLINSEKWYKINYTQYTIEHAMNNFEKSKAPFWDLLIGETMKENGIIEIVTENEKDFESIPGIKVTNPFKP